jgi:hypothetical protein
MAALVSLRCAILHVNPGGARNGAQAMAWRDDPEA